MKPAPASPGAPRRKVTRSDIALTLTGLVIASVATVASLWSATINRQIDISEVLIPREVAPGSFATVNGFDLHYRLIGDPLRDPTGAPLVLVHGFASSSDEFRKIEAALAVSRSLILPDLLGFGYSQRVTDTLSGYTQRSQAALVGGVLDQLGVTQVDAIGASYGGAIVTQFALDNPGRVRRIGYLDGQVYDGGGGPPGWLMGLLPFRIGRAITWNLLGGGAGQAQLLASACVDAAACVAGLDPRWRENVARIEGNTDALLAISSAPREQYADADIRKITMPALLIWGGQDSLVPLDRGKRLAAELPNARLEIIPAVGHVPHLERPAAVIPLLVAFFGR
ncbi:MAG: alpha/beta hydrolase [Thermoflexales bacterium]